MNARRAERHLEPPCVEDLTRLPAQPNAPHAGQLFGQGGDCALPQCMPSRVRQDDRFQFHPDGA